VAKAVNVLYNLAGNEQAAAVAGAGAAEANP